MNVTSSVFGERGRGREREGLCGLGFDKNLFLDSVVDVGVWGLGFEGGRKDTLGCSSCSGILAGGFGVFVWLGSESDTNPIVLHDMLALNNE